MKLSTALYIAIGATIVIGVFVAKALNLQQQHKAEFYKNRYKEETAAEKANRLTREAAQAQAKERLQEAKRKWQQAIDEHKNKVAAYRFNGLPASQFEWKDDGTVDETNTRQKKVRRWDFVTNRVIPQYTMDAPILYGDLDPQAQATFRTVCNATSFAAETCPQADVTPQQVAAVRQALDADLEEILKPIAINCPSLEMVEEIPLLLRPYIKVNPACIQVVPNIPRD